MSVLKKGLGGKKDKIPHSPQCSPLLGAVSSLGQACRAGEGNGDRQEEERLSESTLALTGDVFIS